MITELYEAEFENEFGGEFSSENEDELSISLEPESSFEEKLETEEFHYQVLSTEEIEQHMVDCIREVNTVVQIPPTITRILLNHFKWDKEKLYEKYYDDDQDAVFKEAHIIHPYLKTNSSFKDSQLARKTEKCEICLRIMPHNMLIGATCNHCFCSECWEEYLTIQIMGQGMCQFIACPAYGCNILVDDQTVMSLITDPKVKLKYKHLITNSFVECNRLLRWCPQSGCNYVISVQYVDARPVTCHCRHVFCFACGESCHDPVKCSLLRKWQKKCNDDSETTNWIEANTKECPSCKAIIEKSGGCNHMICQNHNCNCEFCWACLTPWSHHVLSLYECNRYYESETKSASRAALQRYLFYYDRYLNHMQSIKLENKLYSSAKDKIEEIWQQSIYWPDEQFLKTAVDILHQCRQTLMYTYVFAYYLKRNNQSVIFENNQWDLESATETLSEYLERGITQKNISDVKQRVQDKSWYCESRRKALLNHVSEGYEKDWWEYID